MPGEQLIGITPCFLDLSSGMVRTSGIATGRWPSSVRWVCVTTAERDMEAMKVIVGARPCETETVFNSNKGKRFQHPLKLEDIGGALGMKIGWLKHFLTCAYPYCSPEDWVCLYSTPKCEEQQPHADYERADIEEAAKDDPRAYPFACECAIHVAWDGVTNVVLDMILIAGIANMNYRAKLQLFVLNSEDMLVRLVSLVLNPGDVIVMRGDTIHAGAAYRCGHFGRIHCYLDNPAVLRNPNRTDRTSLPDLTTNAVETAKQRKKRRKKTW